MLTLAKKNAIQKSGLSPMLTLEKFAGSNCANVSCVQTSKTRKRPKKAGCHLAVSKFANVSCVQKLAKKSSCTLTRSQKISKNHGLKNNKTTQNYEPFAMTQPQTLTLTHTHTHTHTV